MVTDNTHPDDGHDADDRPPGSRVTSSEADIGVVLSTDQCFRLLADTRQRYVLYYLVEREGRAALSELADTLAAWEGETRGELTAEEVRTRVRARLVHAGLPKLQDAGLVTYDAETGEVRATPPVDDVEPYLEFARSTEPDAFERFCELMSGTPPPEDRP